MPSSACQKNALDRKSTRLNSSHTLISYAVFCLKKKLHPHRCRPAERGARLGRQGDPGGPQPRVAQPGTAPPESTSRRPAVAGDGFFFLKNRAPPETTPFPYRRSSLA